MEVQSQFHQGSQATSWTFQLMLPEFKLVHNSSKPIWHVAHLIWVHDKWPKIMTLLIPSKHIVSFGLYLSSHLLQNHWELRGPTVAMPSHMRKYNYIDDALHSQIIHLVFTEG